MVVSEHGGMSEQENIDIVKPNGRSYRQEYDIWVGPSPKTK